MIMIMIVIDIILLFIVCNRIC